MTNSEPDNDQIKIDPKVLLSCSVVTYNSDANELRSTLASLTAALHSFDFRQVEISIVDNSTEDAISCLLETSLRGWNYKLIRGHGNVGFGIAHNIAMKSLGKYHLILNPDITMEPDALDIAIKFLEENSLCGLVSPHAVWPNGSRQYLCKTFPSVFDLFLRGFGPKKLQGIFSKRLSRYELREQTQKEVFWDPPIVSGCFMFFRSRNLQHTGGFDSRYFLYFEDFDLSLRSRYFSRTAYVPAIRITHAGGHASRKGTWHIRQFLNSALKFYKKHGIKLT